MKITLPLVLICVAASALAQPSKPLVPTPEDIRQGYLELLYEKLLQEIKVDNFGSAKFIAAEIEKVLDLKVTSSNLAPCGTWVWLGDGLVVLHPSGKVGSGEASWAWTNEEQRRLRITWENGYIDNLVLSEDLQTMESKNNRGWVFIVHRLPPAEQGAAANP